ncbi:hypothetical protein A9G11_00140 [Gilliamella sp. wkB108]|uniref:restriction endonuclease subunit S n=1 Tax=Gilliamella sp. wkB108 TaxID=3120256 RepID=UPI00080DE01D|nr:restriction endonuclease subunit S [Gilliamella apicola]OCG21581.1 hypothetical protein A9G11_00140 [Gilliamella apicola]
MSADKKVPAIRFKGFHEEWKSTTLGASISYTKGFAFKSSDYQSYGIRIIRVSDLTQNNLSESSNKIYISRTEASLYSKYVINNGDIVITTVGSKAEMRESAVGRAIFFTKSEDYLLNQNLVKVTPLINNDSRFLYNQLLRKQYAKFIEDIQRGNANQANIAISDLWEYSLNSPINKKEQTQIGNYFQKLDTLINQHQNKHDKLCNIKKAMLEKMFPKQGKTMPEIRFKGFSGEWGEIELSDEVTFLNGRAYSQEELQDKGKYPVLRVGNFYTNSSWYYSDMELGDKYYADYGDLLYTWSASFGPHIWNGDKVIYHYHIWKLEISENIDKLFLLHLLDYDRAKILSGSNGSTMIHITKTAMESKKVFIPKKQEQIAIGNYFQKLDNLINQHQQQITKLKNIKQACLSKMFV